MNSLKLNQLKKSNFKPRVNYKIPTLFYGTNDIPLPNEKITVRTSFENLIYNFTADYFSYDELCYWNNRLKKNKPFKSISVTLLISFEKADGTNDIKFYDSKVSLLVASETLTEIWQVFIQEVLKSIDNEYNTFKIIKRLKTFKMVLTFQEETIENTKFTSGKLVDYKFDEKNRLIFSVKNDII